MPGYVIYKAGAIHGGLRSLVPQLDALLQEAKRLQVDFARQSHLTADPAQVEEATSRIECRAAAAKGISQAFESLASHL